MTPEEIRALADEAIVWADEMQRSANAMVHVDIEISMGNGKLAASLRKQAAALRSAADTQEMVEREERHIRELQRCTCPATPGEIRKVHEDYCPWAIADSLARLVEQNAQAKTSR